MKYRAWSTTVACLVAALLAGPSYASAARHHKHKPKRAAPEVVTPGATQPDDAETGAGADDSTRAPEVESVPAAAEPPARGKSNAVEAEEDAPPAPASPKPARGPSAPVEIASMSDEGYVLAVGRREAARVAAGRIEAAVSIGIDVGRRHFTYSDPIGNMPRPYLLAAAPLATFELEVYPLASSGIPVLRDLGFRGRVSRAFALESGTTTNVPLDNSWTRFTGELRGRVLVPGRTAFQLGVSAGVDGSYFDLDTGTDVGALVPAARMLSFRLGTDARFRVAGRLSLLVAGAYLASLTHGEIYDRFRRPRVAGLDTELAAAIALTPGSELRLGGRYTRYFASFDPQVGDAAVAGGALDEQMQLGVAFRYAH